ncbi:hypothetical protein E1267_43535 [Nonomuraea longispora]|uniref:DUF4352 domain-containing protein n=1 Tax=Nonomuraea longispora TaxID=1848320 RepID=A0A4R4MC37_9ACTN|nr:hypothetical protein [Nonomuraea longispora]TDB93140.1 hypothetical protein E1267_43535 [Nonomuraea longispora]
MTATQPRSSAAPARRGRRGGRRPANTSRLLNAVAGLVLAGAAVLLQTMSLNEGEQSLPLTYVGDKGEDVDAKRFTVRVDSYVTARSIRSLTGKTIGTDHLFLVVNASAKSSLKPYKLGQPVLMTEDGKKFSATDRVDSSQTLSNVWVQPDIWVSGRYFFEVPASALPGARVVFGLPQAFIMETYQPEIEVDLGLDEAGARKLAASPQDVYSMDKK